MTAERTPERRSGDSPTSFAALYAEQYRPMVRLATLLTGSNAIAEELVQDAFVNVHRHWERADQPVAYLRAAVVNACRSYHRRRFLERDRRPDPKPEVVAPETDEVWDTLLTLPARQRAALVLRFYEDLPEQEIARVLGCRPGTVKSLIHRGLAALRKVVEP